MNDTVKKALWAALVALGVLIATLLACYFPNGDPSAVPSPSPSPSALASPSPSPSPSAAFQALQGAAQKPYPGLALAWGSQASLSGSRNEVVSAVLKATGSACAPLSASSPAGVSVSFLAMGTFTTTKPSYVGATVGAQYDPLLPATQACPGDLIWADVSIGKSVSPGQYQLTLAGVPASLTVWKMTLPDNPTHPVYMEVTGAALLAGHKLDPNSNVAVQASLTQLYVNMARAHRIEPYKQRVTDLSVNADGTPTLDQWSTYGGSFRQLVFTGNIAPGMVDPMVPSAGLTQSLVTALGQIPAQYPGAWAYVMDEPNTSALMTEAQARAKILKQYAPAVKTMVTIEWSSALDPYVDVFCPHDLFFNQPGHVAKSAYTRPYWLYGSCMNHGSCGDGTLSSVGTLPGPPDLLIDLPMAHPRAYAWVNSTLGAKASVYYATVEGYLHYGVFRDTWLDQYVFSGNGDGTLFYPGRTGERGFTSDQPVASLRLKAIRQGSYDLEYVALAKAKGVAFTSPVTDQMNWSKNYSDYEAARLQIGAALNSLP